jgi:hypothetical protein
MSAFARRYLRNRCLFLFLQVLRCFSSLGSLPAPMNSVQDDSDRSETRFRIQTSPDQRLFASFPELIAGYHVFRRLSMPRHPPHTLSSLTTFIDHRALIGRIRPEQRTDNESNRQKRCSTIPIPALKQIDGKTKLTYGWESRRYS